MPTVAEQLNGAREALGLTIYQVAETTKIKTDHVRALDKGDYDAFAAPVYIRGFVRSYATLLKLDVPQVMRDLDQELAKTDKFSEPPSLGPQSHGALDFLMFQFSKVNWRLVLLLIALVTVIGGGVWGYRAWATYKSKDPLSDLGNGKYQPATNSGQTLPLPKPAKK